VSVTFLAFLCDNLWSSLEEEQHPLQGSSKEKMRLSQVPLGRRGFLFSKRSSQDKQLSGWREGRKPRRITAQ
jgi:hypothetical protein